MVINGECCSSEFVRIRHATEEEKKELFDLMQENGLQWNTEEKKVEKIRWRAEIDKRYFIVGCSGNRGICTENDYQTDNNLYEFGNYFRTEEQAQEAAKRVKETLRKYHEEIGE